MVFFTSDLHLGHRNIIRLCNRPFSSIDEMDQRLIEKWNEKVTDADTVYILGDLMFRNEKPPEEYLRQLRGKKHLIIGNHDRAWIKKCNLSFWFESTSNLLCTTDGKLRGMVTDRDLVLRCVAAENDPATTPVRSIMSGSVVTVSPTDDVAQVARKMADAQIRRLPVVKGGKVVGMLALGDMARQDRYDMEAAKALSEISSNIRRL